jgi:hypothetical protein
MRALPVALLSLALAAPASAQSLYGPGGLFLHPTAAMPAEGQLTPSILVLPQKHPPSDATRTWFSAGLDYGLTKQIEIGVTYLEVFNWRDTASLGGYLKFSLRKETERLPAVAFGFNQLAFGDFDARTAFLTARKRVYMINDRWPVTLNVGGMYVHELDGIKRSEFVPYGGVEIGIDRSLSFSFEGRPKMDGDFGTPLALALNWRPDSNWSFALTWANTGQSGDPRFGFGAGLTLGSRR